MKRRAVLATLATSVVAGCASSSGDSNSTSSTTHKKGAPSTTTTTATRTTTETNDSNQHDAIRPVNPGGGPMSYSVSSLKPTSKTLALAAQTGRTSECTVAAAFRAPATTDHPARLSVTFENPNNYAETVGTDTVPFLVPKLSGTPPFQSDGSRIWFAPTENHPLAETVPKWGRNANGEWTPSDQPTTYFPKTIELDAGEDVTGEYVLLAGHGKRIETGTYGIPGDSTIRLASWDTKKPGPTQKSTLSASGKVSGEPRGNSIETSWFSQATNSTSVFLRPSTVKISAPAEIEFTLVNHTREKLAGNEWQLYKQFDGQWYPLRWNVPTILGPGVAPGRTRTWTLQAYHHAAIPADKNNLTETMDFLGGGRYAFAALSSAPDSRQERASTAAFDIDAPSVSVRPEKSATMTRDDTTANVDARNSKGTETTTKPGYVLRRISSADWTLLSEQVMQNQVVRNTVPFVSDGVNRVVLTTDAAWPFADRTIRFRLDGTAYELEAKKQPGA